MTAKRARQYTVYALKAALREVEKRGERLPGREWQSIIANAINHYFYVHTGSQRHLLCELYGDPNSRCVCPARDLCVTLFDQPLHTRGMNIGFYDITCSRSSVVTRLRRLIKRVEQLEV